MPTWDGNYSQIAEWWQVASDNFVSHNRPKAGVGGIQFSVFSKKASERQRLAERAMRSLQNLFINRVALAAGAACDEWLVAGEKWEPESAART